MDNLKEIEIDGKLIRASRVSSIVPVGPRHVFNIEVEAEHNYYANGMLTANSTYHSLLDHYSKKYNEELYKIKDTFITYKHRRLLIYPSGPNKKTLRGRCLIGDTLVNTNYGFLKLSELISFEGFRPVSGLRVDSPCGLLTVSHTFKEQVSLTYVLVTELGFSLQGTPEHPVLTDRGWRELSQLSIGDEILVRADNEPSYGLSTITEDEVQLILGDQGQFQDQHIHELPFRIRQATQESLTTFLLRLFSKENPGFRGIDDSVDLVDPNPELANEPLSITQQDLSLNLKSISGEITGRLTLLRQIQVVLLHLGIVSKLDCDELRLKIVGPAPLTMYDRLLKIYPVREERFVYDLTVPGHHLFTANGLTSHNTRFFCLTGDTLVSTDQGLIPIRENLKGKHTHINGEKTRIIDWQASGEKEVFRLELVTGHVLRGSEDHRVRVYQDGSLGWKKIKHLNLTDRVVLSLGGNFPTQLKLNYEEPEDKPAYIEIIERMTNLESFNKTDILEPPIPNFSQKSVWAITSKLVKAGFLIKHYHKGSMVTGMDRCFYEKSESFEFEALSSFMKGPLRKKKDKIRYPETLTDSLSALLGYYNADGSYNEGAQEFSYCTSDDKKAKEFKSCFTKSFGISPRYATFNTLAGIKMHQYTVAVKPIKSFLRYVGLNPATSEGKVVPWVIKRGSKSNVIAYLRALTTSDGSIDPQLPEVNYKTISYKLATQVQMLLATLGIFSRIIKFKRSPDRSTTYLYYVHMAKADAYEFLNLIGIKAKHKTSRNYKFVTIDGPIFAAKVRRITQVGVKQTYDIAVDSHLHGFTANGVIVHNSSVDEIGWFDHNADKKLVKMDANEVYIALDRSLLTVRAATNRLVRQGFDNIPTGYAFNISSPSSARDKIMELVTQSQHSRKLLGFKKATWEMNPEITKADLSEEFSRDPQAAERDYGCNPPLSDNAFFSSYASISGCFVGKKNKLSYNYMIKKGKDGGMTRYATIMDLAASTKPNVLAIDAGFSNNSFSMVTGHLHNGIPILTCFCEVPPLPGIPLNHALIFREVIMPLIKARNVKLLVSDRWQNIKLLQDAELEVEDLTTVSLSLKYSHFWIVKQAMFDSEVVMPRLSRPVEDILKYDHSKYPLCFNDPVEHLVLQFLTVRDQGNAVIKGDNVTDDTFRCCCLAYTLLMDPEFDFIFNGEGQEVVQEKASIGIVQSRGSASRSLSDAKTSNGKPLGVYAKRTV